MPVRTGPRSSPWTTVRCSHCGSGFPLSIRNQQQCRSDGREPLCTSCRRPPVKLRDAERQRLEAVVATPAAARGARRGRYGRHDAEGADQVCGADNFNVAVEPRHRT